MSDLILKIKSAKVFLFGILLAVFVFARLICLDADTPVFKLMSFSSIDEFYYSITSFNLYHFNSFINTTIPFAEMDASPLMLFLNFFTTVTLKIFGNNYYGLRFGSGLCSLVLFLFLIHIILKTSVLNKSNSYLSQKQSTYILFFVLLFFSIDFSFLVASRVADPGISRSLILVILMWYIATKENILNNKTLLFSFVLGFLALFSVFFVYLYNIFLFGAAGLALLLIFIKDKRSLSSLILNVCMFIFGAVLCYAAFELFLQVFFKKSFLDYIETLTHFSETRVAKKEPGIMAMIMNIKQLFLIDFGTNMFRLNFGFLIVSLFMLPVFFYRTFRLKKNIDIFISCAIVLWLAQSFFENTYPLKRHTIMFPLFFLMILYASEELINFMAVIKRNVYSKVFTSIYVLTAIYIVYYNSSKFFRSCTLEFPDLKIFFVLNALCALIVFALFFWIFRSQKIKSLVIYVGISVLIFPSFFMVVNKIIVRPTYQYKEAMVDIGKQVGSNKMIGGVSYGFILYNSTKPTLNVYIYVYTDKPEFKRRFCELLKSSDYTVLCPSLNKTSENKIASSPIEMDYLKEISKETGFSFELVKSYDIGDRNVLLVKKTSILSLNNKIIKRPASVNSF